MLTSRPAPGAGGASNSTACMSRAIRTAITTANPANNHHCIAYAPLRSRPRPSGSLDRSRLQPLALGVTGRKGDEAVDQRTGPGLCQLGHPHRVITRVQLARLLRRQQHADLLLPTGRWRRASLGRHTADHDHSCAVVGAQQGDDPMTVGHTVHRQQPLVRGVVRPGEGHDPAVPVAGRGSGRRYRTQRHRGLSGPPRRGLGALVLVDPQLPQPHQHHARGHPKPASSTNPC